MSKGAIILKSDAGGRVLVPVERQVELVREFGDRLASLRVKLDAAKFVAFQNPARSVTFGHKRHSAYATTFLIPYSRGARLDAYQRSIVVVTVRRRLTKAWTSR